MPTSVTRLIGEAVNAINAGKFVKVKDVGTLILNNTTRKRRTREEMARDKKKETSK